MDVAAANRHALKVDSRDSFDGQLVAWQPGLHRKVAVTAGGILSFTDIAQLHGGSAAAEVVDAVEVKVILANRGNIAHLQLRVILMTGVWVGGRCANSVAGTCFLAAQYLVLAGNPGALHRLAAAGNTELAEERRNMILDRALGAMQPLGDFAVREPLRQQLEHLSFTRR